MTTTQRIIVELPRDDGGEEADLETLRAFVAEGIAEADAGRFVDTEEMFERLRARYEAIVANRSGG